MVTSYTVRIFVLLVALVEISCHYHVCPKGWLYNPGNDHCYQFNDYTERSWTGALAHCRLQSADLLSYQTKDEKDWVIKYMLVTYYWSGLNDRYLDGHWRWSDHSFYNATLVNWAPREPNNWGGREDCGATIWNSQANDMPCEWKLPYICKRRPRACPAGWVECPYNGMCYQYVHEENEKKSWAAALEDCEQKGANLVSYETADEKKWVLSKMARSSVYWCGLNDLQTDGVWTWSDNAPYSEKLANWAPGEPNNWGGNEDCAITISNAQMNDMSCQWELPYICKGPKV